MIVKCERCQTRFKIPDEKVTEKGVKVRCTKCQNTFRVTREAATAGTGAPPAPPPAGQADPFAAFGVAKDPRHVEITKPGYYAQGVEASRPLVPAQPPPAPWNSVDVDMEDGVFQEPTRVGPIPLPPAARPPPAGPPAPARGAVPLPPPIGDFPEPAAPGLYGSAVPPGPAAAQGPSGGAVPLPGVAAPRGGPSGGAVPLPGVAAPGRAAVPTTPVYGSMDPAVPPAPDAFAAPGAAAPPRPGGAALAGASSPPPPGASAASGLSARGAPGAALGGPAVPPAPGAPAASGPPAPGRVAPPLAVPPPAPVTMFGPSKQGAPPPAAGARRAAAPAPGAAPAFAAGGGDPFADFLSGPAPGGPPLPGLDDLPVPAAPAADALRRAATAPPPASPPTGAMALGPVRPAPPVASPGAGAFVGDDPFSSIDIEVTPAPPAAAAAPPMASPGAGDFVGDDPFGSIDIDDATVPSAPSPLASPPPPAPAASAPAPAASASVPQPAPAPAAPPSANDLFDLGADPFGELSGVQPTDTGRAALLGAAPPASDGLEGLDEASGGPSLLGDVPPVDEAQEFKVSIGQVGAPSSTPEVLDVGAVPKPTARPEDVGIPQSRPPSRALKATALVANLVVAAVLVVGLGAVGLGYLREGRVDLSVLSPGRLRALVAPQALPLVAVDVSNGLYETREGRPVFFIRGEALNRTAAATRVRVRAALYDGAQRVRSAEALVGALPTPEELHAAGNTEAASALRQRLDAAAAAVAPGAKAPFLVMFHEYPADLGSFRLEVTLEAAPAEEAAARPE